MTNHCTLQQLQLEIKQTLSAGIAQRRWVTAEISEMNSNYSGHCYLELIERKPNGNDVLAKMRATIWSHSYRMLKAYFETTSKTELKRGLKVLVCGSVEYHEVWGISLNITDIDPIYTIGEQARRKQEIIAQLEADGVIDMNKQLDLPLVVQRVAVISSATAAGYGDFVNQLQNNAHGYHIQHTLFTAVMQGKDTEASVVAALDAIYAQIDEFDAVVLIRGGGSQSDLSSFDSYDIAANIAQFPLPVFTGIGHERDDTVADMVAHTRLKTPTAVAEFILARAENFDALISQAFDRILSQAIEHIDTQNALVQQLNSRATNGALQVLHANEHAVQQLFARLSLASQRKLADHQNILLRAQYTLNASRQRVANRAQKLDYLDQRIKTASVQALVRAKKRVQALDEKLQLLDPQRLLERGYSLSFNEQGGIVRSVADVKAGQELQTRLRDGVIMSVVQSNFKIQEYDSSILE